MQTTTLETESKVKEPAFLFDQAKSFLIREKMVVITGVQGSGKTFLAKSLVNDLQNDGNEMKSVLICNLNQLHWNPGEQVDIYIIDDIFQELQEHDKFVETLTALSEFLSHAGETYFIITIPSYTWANNCEDFDSKFYKVQVNLDERKDNEKLAILQSLKTQYDLSNDQLVSLNELKNDLLVTSFECIGFPALVSRILTQTNGEQQKKCLCYPLETMRDEISTIKNGTSVVDRGKFLVLSYMCFKDEKMDVQNVDITLFEFLKFKYAPKFEDEDLAKCCEGMVGYYLLTDGDGCYEFDSKIMKNIVCDILAKDNCKRIYSKYLKEKNTFCARDGVIWNMNCFSII